VTRPWCRLLYLFGKQGARRGQEALDTRDHAGQCGGRHYIVDSGLERFCTDVLPENVNGDLVVNGKIRTDCTMLVLLFQAKLEAQRSRSDA
jgi:hypothetical protein